MTVKVLDTVVLTKDLPTYKLKKGDLGAVVEVYAPDGLEVEFVTGSGPTQALVTLKTSDVRTVGPADILAVRTVGVAQGANNRLQRTVKRHHVRAASGITPPLTRGGYAAAFSWSENLKRRWTMPRWDV
jgi:hypothetical protein